MKTESTPLVCSAVTASMSPVSSRQAAPTPAVAVSQLVVGPCVGLHLPAPLQAPDELQALQRWALVDELLQLGSPSVSTMISRVRPCSGCTRCGACDRRLSV